MSVNSLKSEVELTKLIATREVDKYKRKCVNFEESVSRLQHDLKISREREMKDEEKINNLLTKLEINEKDSTEKLVELKMKIFDLETSGSKLEDDLKVFRERETKDKEKMNNLLRKMKVDEKGSSGKLAELKRKIFNLEELVSRLQNDLKLSKEREMKDQEKMNNLLTKNEMNEKASTEKLGQLKMKILDLEETVSRLQQDLKLSREREMNGEEKINNFLTEMKIIEKDSTHHKLVELKRKGCFSEVQESYLPSEIGIDTPTKESSAGKSKTVRTAGLEEKRMCKTLDPRSTSTPTKADNITAQCAITTVQKERRKDSTNPRKSSSRPMKRSKTFDARPASSSRNPIIASCSKVSNEKVQAFCRSGVKDRGREYKGRVPSTEQIAIALTRAEMLQSNLSSHNPSFIRPMVPSNVSSGFWLSIPGIFCKENLCASDGELNMILEDEKGLECNSKLLIRVEKYGLSGGWRGFAIAHNLELGDTLVFELTEPSRFKSSPPSPLPEHEWLDQVL